MYGEKRSSLLASHHTAAIMVFITPIEPGHAEHKHDKPNGKKMKGSFAWRIGRRLLVRLVHSATQVSEDPGSKRNDEQKEQSDSLRAFSEQTKRSIFGSLRAYLSSHTAFFFVLIESIIVGRAPRGNIHNGAAAAPTRRLM